MAANIDGPASYRNPRISARRCIIVAIFLGSYAIGLIFDEKDWVVNFAKATTQRKGDPYGGRPNPHYGWQPRIPDSMNCSWRQCFQSGHSCSSCRDSVEDLGKVPVTPDNWIPDVTMLHRMMLAGKDANGQPWPPPLDLELCEDIGTDGGRLDISKELLEKIPLKATPLSPSEKTPKIMCMVYSMKANHATNIRAMRETWAPYCDGFLVFSTASDPRIPAMAMPHDGPEDYKNMWQKIRSILKFVGTHYLDDFDFFYQGGDDLFVIPQNLKRYLQQMLDDDHKTPEDDYFVGRRFHGSHLSGLKYFNTGGAGYALSRGTLRKYVNRGWNHTFCSPTKRTSMEDVMISTCLRRAFGIGLTDTRDEELRERFHHFPPDLLYQWRPPTNVHREYQWHALGKGKNEWYLTFNRDWPPLIAEMCCSPGTVSFHYIKQPAMVRHLYALINACDESAGLSRSMAPRPGVDDPLFEEN